MGPTLFRWKADFDTALTCFEQAATLYRSIMPPTDSIKGKAKIAFEKASYAQEKTGSCVPPPSSFHPALPLPHLRHPFHLYL